MNFILPYIGNFIIPIDELIFFRGVAQPPTSISCREKTTTTTVSGICSMKPAQWHWTKSEIPKIWNDGGFLSHGGTRSHHPIYWRDFLEQKPSSWGTPMTLETHICCHSKRLTDVAIFGSGVHHFCHCVWTLDPLSHCHFSSPPFLMTVRWYAEQHQISQVLRTLFIWSLTIGELSPSPDLFVVE